MTSRRYSRIRVALYGLLAFALQFPPGFASAQTEPTRQPVVSFPSASTSRVPSPNRKWILVFECPKECSENILSIEESGSHAKRLIGKYERNLSVSWSPDGGKFFVTDNYGSDGSLSYVYDPISLKRTSLADLLVASNPHADKFLKAGHVYLKATQWVDPHELIIVLYGHFDEPPPRGFSFQYRIDLNGSVHKLPASATP